MEKCFLCKSEQDKSTMKSIKVVHITGNYDHPTKKTEKLSTLMIKSTTRENDLVVIPFAGSGTECAMSVKDSRKFIAFEIEEKYVKMSNDRVQNILRQPSLFVGS